jgi:hypothetical protein
MQSTHTQVQKKIAGVEFPASRDRLIEFARRNGADAELLGCMRALPDRAYEEPGAVGDAFADVFGR